MSSASVACRFEIYVDSLGRHISSPQLVSDESCCNALLMQSLKRTYACDCDGLRSELG